MLDERLNANATGSHIDIFYNILKDMDRENN